jgi:zinc and cadmium transporter
LDPTLLTILGFGILMSFIAVVGGLLVFLPDRVMRAALEPTVAFAAGTLIGGALFFMLPHALSSSPDPIDALKWVVVGFASFFVLDQLLEWHHCHRPPDEHVRPLGPLLLIADGLHNLLGGLAIGAIFVVDIEAGIAAWMAAAMHELPQEFGDYGAIVHAGFSKGRALALNFLSALTFPLGGVAAWAIGQTLDVGFLVALGCGNFLYIAAADLIPEIKRSERLSTTAVRFLSFVGGAGFLYAGRLLTHGHGH